MSDKINGRNIKLEFDTIHLGKILANDNLKSIQKRRALSPKPYIGVIENVIFNSDMMIERSVP